MTPGTVDLSNLSRSLNEMLVLSVLEDGPRHGYQLALDVERRSDGMFVFKHGTLYPILHRLERERLIAGSWTDEGPRGRRRAYRLTDRGRKHVQAMRDEWREVMASLARVMEEGS